MISTIKKVSVLLLFSQLFGQSSAGKCPFGFGSDSGEVAEQAAEDTVELQPKRILEEENSTVPPDYYPADILQCKSDNKVLKTVSDFDASDYEEVVESVNQLYDSLEDEEDSKKQQAAFAGCLVRLAGHDFMDFRYEYEENKKGKMMKAPSSFKGGSDGCINFADKDNMGLAQCIKKFNLTDAYNEHCEVVSLADFIVIAAEAVMGRTATSYNENDEYAINSLQRTFRDQFKAGRTTTEKCEWNKGLMPDPEDGCDGINSLFKDHIFKFSKNRQKKEFTAAIMGAHTLGSAKLENSGYQGSWSSKGNEGIFNNDYFRSMLTKGWGPDLSVGGNNQRNQWKRVDNGTDSEHHEMMLNSDLCLAYDNNIIHQKCMKENNNNNKKCKEFQNKGKSIIATAGNCCAWTNKNALFGKGVFNATTGGGNLCGTQLDKKKQKGTNFTNMRNECCVHEAADSTGDCDSAAWPKGQTFPFVLAYAAKEDSWLSKFVQAWNIATENGLLDLQHINPQMSEYENEYECGKLRTRRMCKRDKKCVFKKTTLRNKRGKFIKKCVVRDNEDNNH